MYCLAEAVPTMKDADGIVTTDAFQGSDIGGVTLHVPSGAVEAYNAVEPWSSFGAIVVLSGEEIPVKEKCDKPNIIMVGNKIRFECDTPGATFTCRLSPNVQEQVFVGTGFELQTEDVTYTLTVIVSADGYEDSDPAQMTITIDRADVNRDGKIDVADIATVLTRMASGSRQQEDTAE